MSGIPTSSTQNFDTCDHKTPVGCYTPLPTCCDCFYNRQRELINKSLGSGIPPLGRSHFRSEYCGPCGDKADLAVATYTYPTAFQPNTFAPHSSGLDNTPSISRSAKRRWRRKQQRQNAFEFFSEYQPINTSALRSSSLDITPYISRSAKRRWRRKQQRENASEFLSEYQPINASAPRSSSLDISSSISPSARRRWRRKLQRGNLSGFFYEPSPDDFPESGSSSSVTPNLPYAYASRVWRTEAVRDAAPLDLGGSRSQSYNARRRNRRRERQQTAPESDPEPFLNRPSIPSVTDFSRTPTQSTFGDVQSDVQNDVRPWTPPTINPATLALVERVWDLEMISQNRDDTLDSGSDIHNWDDDALFSTAPDTSNLGRAAEYASLLLDVFSRVKPVDDHQLTVVQKRLITTAFTSVREITRQIRVLDVSANESLEPLMEADDTSLKVDSGCVVCYDRVADTVLMPCRHLTICKVCCSEIQDRVRSRPGAGVMRCPVCRGDVLDQIQIFRS